MEEKMKDEWKERMDGWKEGGRMESSRKHGRMDEKMGTEEIS